MLKQGKWVMGNQNPNYVYYHQCQLLNFYTKVAIWLKGDNRVFFKFYFIFDCARSSLLQEGFLQLRRVGATLQLRWTGFSLRQLLLLQSSGSSHTGFSSCGTRSQWDLPGPGLKPMSPSLAGGFLSIAPPGKPNSIFIFFMLHFTSHLTALTQILTPFG